MSNNKRNILDIYSDQLSSPSYDDYLLLIHDRWIDVGNREIYMHGVESFDTIGSEGEEPGIEYTMATRIIKNLHILRHADRKAPVKIFMHTCGGIVEEGLAIYDTIKMMPYKVIIYSYTHARSMSSVVLQAADERILMPNSSFMFHRGSIGLSGEANEVRYDFKQCEELDSKVMRIYVESLKKSNGMFKGKSSKSIRKVLIDNMNSKTNVYLKPKEAVRWGFADKVCRTF